MSIKILCALLFSLVTFATTEIKVPPVKVLQYQLKKKGLTSFCSNTSFVEMVASSWLSQSALEQEIASARQEYVNSTGEDLTRQQFYMLRHVIFKRRRVMETFYEKLRKKKLIISAVRDDSWV